MAYLLQSTRWTTVLSLALNLYFMVLVTCLLAFNQFSTFSDERILVECQCAPERIRRNSDDQHISATTKTVSLWSITISKNNQTELKQEHYLAKTEDNAKLDLAVAVMSSPHNLVRRNAIRKTWKNGYEKRTYYVKFVIGIRGQSTKFVEALEKENSEHQDMVLLTHIHDLSYKNIPDKVLASMAWFDRNVNYSYLLKTDDDCFVMLDTIEDELRKRDHSRGLYWGWFSPAGNVERQGKRAEPKWKFCDKYFPYAAGGSYVLSADVIHHIVSLADSLIVYNSDDISVGAWTVLYDIERKHDVRFNSQEKLRGCKNTDVIFHFAKDSVKYIADIDRRYHSSGKLCKWEIARPEFEYDWSKLPSDAYIRKV